MSTVKNKDFMGQVIPTNIHLLHETLEKTRYHLLELVAAEGQGSEFDMPLIIDIESYQHELGTTEVPNFNLEVSANDIIDFDILTGEYSMNLLTLAYKIAPRIDERIKEDLSEMQRHLMENKTSETGRGPRLH